jgi:L-rhamnose mutarotase
MEGIQIRSEVVVQRIAFVLQIKLGKVEEYEEAHRHVWPELIHEMELLGITEYSIFRRGLQLFLYMRVSDFEKTKQLLADSEVNQRWQEMMTPLFDSVPNRKPGEPFAMMEEVFYMSGTANLT